MSDQLCLQPGNRFFFEIFYKSMVIRLTLKYSIFESGC